MVQYSAFKHSTSICLLPFLSFVTNGLYTSGAFFIRISTTNPWIRMMMHFFLLSTTVWTNAFGMSMTATSLSLINHRGALVATVRELDSSFSMYPCCLLPPTTVLPFLSSVHFISMKIWDSSIIFFCMLLSSFHFTWQKEFCLCSCFISDSAATLALLPHIFSVLSVSLVSLLLQLSLSLYLLTLSPVVQAALLHIDMTSLSCSADMMRVYFAPLLVVAWPWE